MNIHDIRELAQIVREHGLHALEIVEKDTRIRLEAAQCAAAPANAGQGAEGLPAPLPAAPAPATPSHLPEHSSVDFNRVYEFKAALVGVFYLAPAPEAAPFVTVGSRVKKGDVLCILEAMKLMNEITSDRDGEIVDICVANGDVVEFGQTLFKLC